MNHLIRISAVAALLLSSAARAGAQEVHEIRMVSSDKGEFRFEPAAESLFARRTYVNAWADYDLDADLDLFVGTGSGLSHFFRNDRGTLRDIAAAVRIYFTRGTRAAAWGDYDADGDPDLLVGFAPGGGPVLQLFENDRTRFTDVTVDAGLAVEAGAVRQPVWIDVDDDLLIDPTEKSFRSDSLGRYVFNDLAPGDYTIRWVLPATTWQASTANDIDAIRLSIASGEQRTDVMLGAFSVTSAQRVNVAGSVFLDLNRNGVLDSGEPIQSFTIYIDGNHDGAPTSGDPGGTGTLSVNVAPSRHRVSVVLPAGWATIGPSAQRAGWNHNSTDGSLIYHLAGNGTIWWTLGITSPILPGNDDSVVAFHSATGMNSVGSFSATCATPKYSNHFVESGLCGGGTSHHHLNISRAYICRAGGC